MISEELPFANNSIPVFAYEGFQYTISNPNLTYTLQTVSNSTGLKPTELYFTKNGNSNYVFAVPDTSNNLTPGTTESFLLSTVSGSIILNSSNTVTVNPGRFLDGSGNSLSNNAYVFYKNEPITPITLVAPSFTLKTPTSIPALPPGLSFVRDSSSIFKISGTPTVTVPNSNYQIIGAQQGGSKIITTRFNMVISNERLQVNISGTPIINNMEIGTPISPRVITAIPPVGSTTVRYTFPSFPDGIVARDICGNVRTSPATISNSFDPSYTLVISGTPTSNAAYFFRDAGAGSNGLPYTVSYARTVPTPTIDGSQTFTFAFGETILFDLSGSVPPLYSGIRVDPSAIFFKAATYFTSNVPITTIFSPNLSGTDLSLSFVSALSRAGLSGEPTTLGTRNFTVTASNANGKTRDLSATLTVSNDTVTFSSPTDLCYNFIVSRSLDLAKTGYYPSPIQFTATAASKLPVTLSAPVLSGTGITLNSNGILTGIPTTVTALGDLNVIATVSGSPATATKTVKFAILDDVITIGDVSASKFQFVQNTPVTPFQIPVTSTLSERGILNYTQTGFPTGVTINSAGVVSGTPTSSSPTSGNVTIRPTTGYSTGSRDFSYNLTPDTILFTVPQSTYLYEAGDPVLIPVTGTSYSGITVSNYALTLPASYGLSINSTSGLLSGNWTNSIPPNQLLPASCNFTITANAGVTGTFPVSFTASPVLERTSFVWSSNRLYAYNESNWTVLSISNVPTPTPVARYDFNTYTASSSNIASSIGTAGNATIYLPFLNSFNTSSPGNKYLNIYAPNNFPGVTGGIQLPTISNIHAIEMWVRYSNINLYSQYVMDARTGASGGFWITGTASTDTIGNDLSGGTVYFNTSNVIADQFVGTPDIGATLTANGGWVQMIIVPPAPITDDVSLFVRYLNQQQGMPISVADIAVYDTPITKIDVQALYNAKCARYGLPALSLLDLPVGFDTVIRNSNVDGNFIFATASNYIYRSTYKNGFTATRFDNSQNCSSLTFKAPTTWWCSGTRDYSGTQTANVLFSDDAGVSWNPLSTLVEQGTGFPLLSRDRNSAIASSNPYLSAGIALKYKDGVLLAGGLYDGANGRVMLRSTDDGETWNSVTGGFTSECAYLNLDVSGMWIATGSDRYQSIATDLSFGAVGSANTIKYSTDKGQTWTPATSGAFNMFGYELVYANNTWVATGVDGGATYNIGLKYSTDGSNWSNVNLGISPDPFTGIGSPVPIAPLPLGSINYDGSNWNIFVQREATPANWVSEIYSTPSLSTPIWNVSNVTSNFPEVSNNSSRRFVTYTRPQYLRPTSSRTINIVLSLAGALQNGPPITSPTTNSFLLYQYVNTEIQLSSSGSNVYFFIERADLPPGLSFNPITNIISGKPSQIGKYSTPIFAQDASGVTLETLSFDVIVPRVIRQQDGAGAYTSLLRQYTDVLAAQNARDSRVLPTQTQRLGEFMSPVPASVITAPFSTTKCGICGKAECPTINLTVDGNGVTPVLCGGLDGNATGNDFVDGGNAEANVCD